MNTFSVLCYFYVNQNEGKEASISETIKKTHHYAILMLIFLRSLKKASKFFF